MLDIIVSGVIGITIST